MSNDVISNAIYVALLNSVSKIDSKYFEQILFDKDVSLKKFQFIRISLTKQGDRFGFFSPQFNTRARTHAREQRVHFGILFSMILDSRTLFSWFKGGVGFEKTL